MKKRIWIPLVSVVGLAGLTAIGVSRNESQIKQCNAGSDSHCIKIADLHGPNYSEASRITNPAYAKAITPEAIEASKSQEEKQREAKKSKEKAQRIEAAKSPEQREADKVYKDCVEWREAAIKVDGEEKAYKYFTCEENKARMLNWKDPFDRLKDAGGQTALVRRCERELKPTLKDPGSYQYVSGRAVVPTDSTIRVDLQFRAKNSFGALDLGKHWCSFAG